ncbi:hypothetical protein J2S43_004714 [Catenuloplanes nepalensis]|uniref:Uncharacterized protein n=1 Tax=Catenuloplanes nepalensis TaxID=587533 RepID=A0ABT9MXP3_9ACTN|nr:hypothetical protein [Catenuloplanes nepalensis]MDP9796202.1 hypothetical protein [Catenuloplanes nepalensis]
MLGSCQVGTVWSAVDVQGRPLTVAVLTAGADARWRDAFAAAANSPDQPRPGPPFLYSDFTAAEPWVACPADGGPGAERIFLSLGQQYIPATPGTGDSPAANPAPTAVDEPTADVTAGAVIAPGPWVTPPHQPISPSPSHPGPVQPDSPWPAGDRPTSGGPVSGPPVSGQIPTYGSPVSGPPVSSPPISGQPFAYGSPVSGPPVSSPPISGQPFAYGGPRTPTPDLEDPFTSPVRRIQPVPRKPRRTGRWIAIAVAIGVLAAGSGAFAWWALGDGQPEDGPRPTAAAESASASASVPAAPPRAPGIEPPKPGEWPAAWPRFAPTDRIRTLTGLDGLGFTLKIPMSWQCVLDGREAGFTRYRCGLAAGDDVQTGGELIVRDCPDQCPKDRQTTMRQAEEAWGLQWIGAGPTAAYAESSTLQIDGEQQYGLVVVAFWRAGSEGAIDRQVVLRMTAPVDGAGQLRRVANYVRDTTIF